MHALVSDNPLLGHRLFVLWQGEPPSTDEDLHKGIPVYARAPHATLVGGPAAPDPGVGRLRRKIRRMDSLAVRSLADRAGLHPDGVEVGTELLDAYEAKPPNVLLVWRSPEALARGREQMYREAEEAGHSLPFLQGQELPWNLVEDYLRRPPMAARPVVAALVDLGSPLELVWRIEGDPDGLVLRAGLSRPIQVGERG